MWCRHALLTLVVTDASVEQSQGLAPAGEVLRDAGARQVALVSVGDLPIDPDDAIGGTSLEAGWVIADDARTAELIGLRGVGWKNLRRTPLGRSVRSIALMLHDWWSGGQATESHGQEVPDASGETTPSDTHEDSGTADDRVEARSTMGDQS